MLLSFRKKIGRNQGRENQDREEPKNEDTFIVRIGDRTQHGFNVNAIQRSSSQQPNHQRQCGPDNKRSVSRWIVSGKTCSRERQRGSRCSRPVGNCGGSVVFHGRLRARIQRVSSKPSSARRPRAPNQIGAATPFAKKNCEGQPLPEVQYESEKFCSCNRFDVDYLHFQPASSEGRRSPLAYNQRRCSRNKRCS